MIAYHGSTIRRELQGMTFPVELSSMSKKEKAFSKLESLRKKNSCNFDYDKELASYREEKFEIENTD